MAFHFDHEKIGSNVRLSNRNRTATVKDPLSSDWNALVAKDAYRPGYGASGQFGVRLDCVTLLDEHTPPGLEDGSLVSVQYALRDTVMMAFEEILPKYERYH